MALSRNKAKPGAPKAQESSTSCVEKEPELRIVLVGKTGGGRSATGNTLLGEKRFESELSSKPLTQTCSRAERAATWKGKRVAVIDTPALFDAHVPEPWGSRETQKCFDLSRPGPHALVFVVQAGRFTEEDRVAAERVEQAFGQGAARYMAVLFTRKEDIDAQSLEDYVKQSGNKALQDLVRKCQNRCCAFNNKATGDDMNIQAEELLSKIEKMVQENRDKPHLKKPPGEGKKASQGGSGGAERDTEESSGQYEEKRPEKEEQETITPEPGSIRHLHEDPDVLIVLVGKTGGGKSATGNTILGEKKFESKLSQQPVTKTYRREVRAEKWRGKRVAVLDTPTIFDSTVEEPQISQERKKCLSLLGTVPHVLVFVTQVGRFTEEDHVAVKRVEQIFGKGATQKMVVLFTRKEDIDTESLEEHVWVSGNRTLQELVRKCENHCCAFNNKAKGEERATQVEELLSKIEELVQKQLPLGKLPEKAAEGEPQADRKDEEGGPGGQEKDPKGTERSEEGGVQPSEELPRKMQKMEVDEGQEEPST